MCRAAPVESLADLTLQELSNLEVTSVSKAAEPLRNAPATIYVITHEDIARSGVTSIAEALRLAPNLQITQYSATDYVAGARGFGGAQEAQNFSNKLLILIDGRSVYSPLYSGVYLDVQDVLMEDIDRIEVISGPGATLWGANAMNGVVNIVTRPAYLTTSSLVSGGLGDREQTLSARYAGQSGDGLSYRVYGKAFRQASEELANGASAQDNWEKSQGGFRADWTGAADSVTAQGDLYRGYENQASATAQRVDGANFLTRWEHRNGASVWQVQGYYDYTDRGQPGDGSFTLNTFDLALQQSLTAGPNGIVWGGGMRLNRYDIDNTASLLFVPSERSLTLGDLFAQETIALSGALDLTLGLKLERDPYSGWTPLPNLRLAWRPGDSSLLWASAARAIRSPTPFDRDVQEKAGALLELAGDSGFKSEEVDAFELGYRAQPWSRLSLSASVFFNIYDDLRTVVAHSSSEFFPLSWSNQMKGDTTGLETWAKWQVLDWWRLSPGLRLLYKDLSFKPGPPEPLGTSQSGNDPKEQALLTSSMDLGSRITFDATLRYVGPLPNPHLDPYCELGALLGGRISRNLDLSLSGLNLLRSRHLEYPDPSGEYIRRSVIAQARWTF